MAETVTVSDLEKVPVYPSSDGKHVILTITDYEIILKRIEALERIVNELQ